LYLTLDPLQEREREREQSVVRPTARERESKALRDPLQEREREQSVVRPTARESKAL